jgi:hypothetical protein
MRRIILLKLALLPLFAGAQNIQLHYDFGKDREFFTSTIEMFKADSLGSTFFFIDFDYGAEKNAMGLAYFEIARYFTLPVLDHKLDVSLQFNDGLGRAAGLGFPIGQVWLAGLSYPINLKLMEVKVDLLYRRADYSEGSDWQFTAAWFRPFGKERLLFSGFIDLWSETRDGNHQIVFQAEPQLWANVYQKLFLGTELEISQNFIPGTKGLKALPTAGLMWYL